MINLKSLNFTQTQENSSDVEDEQYESRIRSKSSNTEIAYGSMHPGPSNTTTQPEGIKTVKSVRKMTDDHLDSNKASQINSDLLENL